MRSNIKYFFQGAALALVPVFLYGYIKLGHTFILPRIETSKVLESYSPSIIAPFNKLFKEPEKGQRQKESSVELRDYLASTLISRNLGITPTPSPVPLMAMRITEKIRPNSPTIKTTNKTETKTASFVVHNNPQPPERILSLIETYSNQYGVNKDMMIHIARCESGFRENAVNGPYAGIYQFVSSTWVSNRKAMGLNSDPNLRFSAEESVKTAAFKMSRDGFSAWPVCQQKAKNLLSAKSSTP